MNISQTDQINIFLIVSLVYYINYIDKQFIKSYFKGNY